MGLYVAIVVIALVALSVWLSSRPVQRRCRNPYETRELVLPQDHSYVVPISEGVHELRGDIERVTEGVETAKSGCRIVSLVFSFRRTDPDYST